MHESHGLCILNLSKIKQSLLFAEIWKWSSKYDHFGLLLNTLKVHLGYTLYTNYEVSKLNLAFLDSYRFKVESESDMTIEEWKLRLMDAFREGKKLEEVEKLAGEQSYLFSLPCLSAMKDMAGFQSLRSSLQSYSRFFVSSWPSIQSPVLLVNFFTKGSESFSLDHIFPILEAIDSHATVSLEVQRLRSAFTQAMDQDAVVGCTASLHSLATFLFKTLLFPEESPWNVKCQPNWYQECLASKHSLINIAPWKLVRGPSDTLAELKGFVDTQEKIGLAFSEVAEGYATLTSFAAKVTARGEASDRNHFYLVLLGSMLMTSSQVPELEVDGLWFEITPRSIQLCVVEAKSGQATGDVDRKIGQFSAAFPDTKELWAPKQQHQLVSWTHLTRPF
ncbi:uncharacterized protein ACA1_023170 [Acanthamoeba castellanii str. Neff]|uniref:Uncharacterized protein n=1 Tax=Acanthamoeba castellanii (strain ATCC 30010 / Neff) TaxID=1257118 RepID=L8HE39_ACACF|nr:uncharacterized protein ACA1_023170 [Acanthamoeba castellanii str. Neff]ELR23804.1 hypothetical protein ACA1_023170 [Acanthamoeba castellanii str. Neff]